MTERRDSGESTSGQKISDVDEAFTEEVLSNDGITLNNIVGSLRLDRQFDLDVLSADLENTEYHPETYPSMIYRPYGEEKSVSVLTPRSGKLAIVGAKSKQELTRGVEIFFDNLENLNISVKSSTDEILIQNIVASYDLNVELDLSVVALALDLESVEYEPEQFPGLIYWTDSSSTVLIFRSGKSVITGAKTYEQVLNSRDEIIEKLRDIGIEEL